MTSTKIEDASYDDVGLDVEGGVNDQSSQSSPSTCFTISSHIAYTEEDTKQKTNVISSSKALHMDDVIGMRKDVNSYDKTSNEFDERPTEKTKGWFKSKVKRFKAPNFVQDLLTSTIQVIRKDSLDNSNAPKFESVDQEKRSIIKNLLVLSIAFMLLSTSFQSMSALRTPFGILRNTFGISTVSNLMSGEIKLNIMYNQLEFRMTKVISNFRQRALVLYGVMG